MFQYGLVKVSVKSERVKIDFKRQFNKEHVNKEKLGARFFLLLCHGIQCGKRKKKKIGKFLQKEFSLFSLFSYWLPGLVRHKVKCLHARFLL